MRFRMARFLSSSMVVVIALWSTPALAHWCSNIFTSPARLVVKPETTSVNVGSGATELRVYLRNNFPYSLQDVAMRGEASGYTITAQPADQDVEAGQDVSYVLSITPDSGQTGDVQVSTLGIQVRFRFGGWLAEDDCMAGDEAPEAMLVARSVWGSTAVACAGGNQSASLSAATLADKYPSTTLASGQPTFGRTGIEQLISFFGYRFCYSAGGSWRSGSQDCPSPAAEGSAWTATDQFPQNCMRAGVELGVRKAQLGSRLQAARDGAVNALSGGSEQHRCIAAVVGGLLWQGATATAFTNALNASGAPQKCIDAGWRVLDGSHATSNCSGGAAHEEASCAAAEGLQGNYTPVTSILMANAVDNSYAGQFYGYMLYLVAGHLRATTGSVPFYPDPGGTGPVLDASPPPPPPVDAAPPPPPPVDAAPPPPPPVDGAPPPPPPTDSALPPTDSGPTPPSDGTPPADWSAPAYDSQPAGDDTPNTLRNSGILDGGCRLTADASGVEFALALLLLCLLRRRRD